MSESPGNPPKVPGLLTKNSRGALDNLGLCAYATLLTPINATTLTVVLSPTGIGDLLFPSSNFNFWIRNAKYANTAVAYFNTIAGDGKGDAAIYRCASRTGDTITCVASGGNRQAQEGTTAIAHNRTGATYLIECNVTPKLFTDLNTLISAVLPSQSTHNGQFLTTDGSAASWAAILQVAAISAGVNGWALSNNGTSALWVPKPQVFTFHQDSLTFTNTVHQYFALNTTGSNGTLTQRTNGGTYLGPGIFRNLIFTAYSAARGVSMTLMADGTDTALTLTSSSGSGPSGVVTGDTSHTVTYLGSAAKPNGGVLFDLYIPTGSGSTAVTIIDGSVEFIPTGTT